MAPSTDSLLRYSYPLWQQQVRATLPSFKAIGVRFIPSGQIDTAAFAITGQLRAYGTTPTDDVAMRLFAAAVPSLPFDLDEAAVGLILPAARANAGDGNRVYLNATFDSGAPADGGGKSSTRTFPSLLTPDLLLVLEPGKDNVDPIDVAGYLTLRTSVPGRFQTIVEI